MLREFPCAATEWNNDGAIDRQTATIRTVGKAERPARRRGMLIMGPLAMQTIGTTLRRGAEPEPLPGPLSVTKDGPRASLASPTQAIAGTGPSSSDPRPPNPHPPPPPPHPPPLAPPPPPQP